MIKEEGGNLLINIEGNLSIYQVEELHKKIRSSLDSTYPVVINLSECDKIDSAGMQFILSLVKELQKRDCKWKCQGLSNVVSEFFLFYGIENFLREGEK